MVKGRGKGKKQCTGEDATSGDEEKILVRRRGRPLKLLKDDMHEEEEFDKMEKQDQEERSSVKNSFTKNLAAANAAKNKRKRKRPNIAKKSLDLVKEENDIEDKANAMKTVGLKTNVSRRKNKPHRAAEVGVEC